MSLFKRKPEEQPPFDYGNLVMDEKRNMFLVCHVFKDGDKWLMNIDNRTSWASKEHLAEYTRIVECENYKLVKDS